MYKLIFIASSFFVTLQVAAQTLSVKADNYLQTFEGAGISAGLYMGHHYSMPSAANRDSAVKFIAKDLNMRYIQDYIDRYPADDPQYFIRRADYLKAAKLYRPDIQVSQVGNKFPDALMIDSVIGGTSRRCLNTNDTAIYRKVAEWYFLMFKAFKEQDVEIDILNVVNEPDFDKVYYYGPNGNTKQNVAFVFDSAVGKFFAMLDDSAINTLHIKKPKIMGPSTISPQGCVEYIQYFKQNYPSVFNMIDIVAYHQYINGVNAGQLATIKSEAGPNKLVYQSEMHTNRGDALGTLSISDELRGCLSLASLFGNSLRTGCNSWFYFQTNYPNAYTPAGLLSIPWQAAAVTPYKHYYAFQQLTSTQPINSKVLEHAKASLPTVDIVCLRKQNTDSVFVNATNTANTAKTMTVSVASATGQYNILQYQVRTTDATNNNNAATAQVFGSPQTQFNVTLAPYSVNTITIVLQNATLPVTWLSANASINGNQQAVVNWKVQENDVASYQIQKSTNGVRFTTIATVASKGDGENNYSFTEPNKLLSNTYYRILQKDISGAESFSEVMLVAAKPVKTTIIFPNPTNNEFVICSNNLKNTTAVLTDVNGKALQNIVITQNNTRVNIRSYSNGIYFLKTAYGDVLQILKQ
jgi:hypothetical protein